MAFPFSLFKKKSQNIESFLKPSERTIPSPPVNMPSQNIPSPPEGAKKEEIVTQKTTPSPPASKEAPLEPVKEAFFLDLRPRSISLPDFKERREINVRYPLIPPYAFAHIFFDEESKEVVYYVEEPVLNDVEKELLELVQLGLQEMINISFIRTGNISLVLQYLEKNVQSILIELGTTVNKETYDKLMYYVFRDSVGLNEIEPLMRDYYIEDIECNGDNFPLYVVHRKYANLRTNILFKDRQKLIDFVEKLAQRCGKYISYAKPILDGALPDGSRVNATYTEDITTRGPTFTIRKFTKDPFTPIQLVEGLAYLWLAIEHKSNVMTIGETASGKTSFLNAIAHFIPPEARICSIEDTRELNLAHINWLPSVTRSGFGIPTIVGGTQYGEITLFDLLKETFRQAPDYVILGETRGSETYVLFQGMASGHPSMCTFHAANVETMVRRLETPPINLPASLVEALDIVIVTTHIKTPEKSIRRASEIVEIIEVKPEIVGGVVYNKVFEWSPTNDTFVYHNKSVVFEKISKREGIPIVELEEELKRRAALLRKMYEQGIVNFVDVTKVINEYYKDKNRVLKQFGL